MHINAIPSANLYAVFISSLRQSWLAGTGSMMFSTCPFVHPFDRSFVHVTLPTCLRYILKTNEPISMQIGTSLPHGKGLNGRPRGQKAKD